MAHNQEKPHTTPYHQNLIYIFTYHYIDFYIGFDGPALEYSPELVVLVDFVFPWGIEYPVVFLPQGLFTLWCLQMA